MHGNLSPAARGRAADADPFDSDSSAADPGPAASHSDSVSDSASDSASDPFADPAAVLAAYGDTPRPPPRTRALRLDDSAATLIRATGSDDARVQDWLVNDLSFALNMPPLPGPEVRTNRFCAAVSALCDIGPRDTMEGMLAAQMVAVHSAALGCLRRAAGSDAADRARDTELRHATRLLNVFQRQMRVRDDRRNPVLAHSLTGPYAPGAPGSARPASVAPEGEREAQRKAGDREVAGGTAPGGAA